MSENSRTWFRLRWRTLFLLALMGIVGWSAYSYWSEYSEQAARKARKLMAPPVGAQCVIHLEGGQLAGGQSATGLFVKLNDDWIVIRESAPESKSQTWIPRQRVQRMRVGP